MQDEALGGGIYTRGITEISGEAGAGKTQICLVLALQVREMDILSLLTH